jgi:hypothetical protein
MASITCESMIRRCRRCGLLTIAQPCVVCLAELRGEYVDRAPLPIERFVRAINPDGASIQFNAHGKIFHEDATPSSVRWMGGH